MINLFNKLAKLFTLFILSLPLTSNSQQKTVMLDYFYNSEVKKNADGTESLYRYTWDSKDLRSYSIWGGIMSAKGIKLSSLETKATLQDLKKADVYIVADPDNFRDKPNPNYMNATDAKAIASWVKKGGVLVMFANDSANADLQHFNILAEKFGMHFTDEQLNPVKKDISVGQINIPDNHEIFKKGRTLYMKEVCTIDLSKGAKSILDIQGKTIFAKATHGKGVVIAIADPWIYDEYIVNDRLNSSFQNKIGAEQFQFFFNPWIVFNKNSDLNLEKYAQVF
jgi:unsaturated rhamnogalacturonyl hydrolase